MPNRNSILIAFLMLTFVGIGYWAYDSNLHVGAQKKQPLIRKNADYYLINTQITQYNETGELNYTLTSNSITHYPHNDTTLLQTPHLESFSDPKKPLVADALNGKLLPGNQDIELWDDVVMTQTDLSNGNKLRMDTDFITIYSEQGLAVTDRPVLITNNTGRTRAIGMEAFYKESLVKLKSRVRGFHEPKP
ncbi:LPS export ABC transporter periplasmic protein LptC [Endozoicomonas arenosclerae]|uniref:LPS export ABC transporter periplasmic protein LptC n=1 Tax=Endozoicomonas arenosclerae TaxID=1633495 RepID=UPI000785B6D4|nr:LPS export ABC transporter periplasmic protein LptC [Endozoicomonas arenosclerae]